MLWSPALITRLRALKLFQPGLYYLQTANITGRTSRGGPLELQKPFPYEEKKFYWYHGLFDKTMLRISEENAKIVVVDGPIAAGKSAFAKVLAEELDMLHIPEATADLYYILPSGTDLRQYDHELPKILRSYDHKDFCINPKDSRAIIYQIIMLYLRFMQLFDAMAHILNTGQGVVLERCFFSDSAFVEAMYEQKYISKEAYDLYMEVRFNTYRLLYPPHLVIYLDLPVPVVQERIRTRNYSYEQNSPALTKEYLQSLEKFWKQKYLPNINKYSEVLVYDWSDGGDVELIIDDIEKLDFNNLRADEKFLIWQLNRFQLTKLRERYTNQKVDMNSFFSLRHYLVPELNIPSYKFVELLRVLKKPCESKYDIGYNPHLGDSIFKILFKSNVEKHRMNKRHIFASDPEY